MLASTSLSRKLTAGLKVLACKVSNVLLQEGRSIRSLLVCSSS